MIDLCYLPLSLLTVLPYLLSKALGCKYFSSLPATQQTTWPLNCTRSGYRLIPITEAMKEPQKFPRVLTGCMVFVAMLFTGFGVMGYMAYGSDIQTVVIVNLPQDDKFVQAVQFLYTVAIILR